ncbi:MAG: hypothetical protein MPW15_26125 [Candidatus Manganitrophus sp.]|nr:hypothetical protein [Candidatus Manganitrophus sp.]
MSFAGRAPGGREYEPLFHPATILKTILALGPNKKAALEIFPVTWALGRPERQPERARQNRE